jgi:hypothetical protein
VLCIIFFFEKSFFWEKKYLFERAARASRRETAGGLCSPHARLVGSPSRSDAAPAALLRALVEP